MYREFAPGHKFPQIRRCPNLRSMHLLHWAFANPIYYGMAVE